MIKLGKYDYSAFPDENILYEKDKLDTTHFKKDDGFWNTFSIPVFKFLGDFTQNIRNNLNINLDFKPDIDFSSKQKNRQELKKSLNHKNDEKEINLKLNDINKILQSIQNKKGNVALLANSVEKLNLLIISFKKKYGEDELEIVPQSLTLINKLFYNINIDEKLLKKLKKILKLVLILNQYLKNG